MTTNRSIRLALACVLAGAAASLAQPAEPPAPEPAAPAEKPPAAEPAPAALSVDPVVICRDVAEREPVEPGTSFPADVGTLCCFTRVLGAEKPVQVYHRWYVGDAMVTEIPISVKGASWRCWSRKTILPAWSGPCRVDVATDAGDVIASQTFTLEAAAE